MDVWNFFLANGRSPSVVWQWESKPAPLLSLSLSPLTEYQAREGKEDDEEEILAVLSFSPSFLCSLLPGSAGRQMTRVCGRLITPGWVFSNLFNGSLLKEKTRWRRRGWGSRIKNTGGRQVSRPSGQASQPSQRRRTSEEEAESTDFPARDTREGVKGEEGKKNTRNIMLIIKLELFLLPATYFSVLIIHILFQ